MPNAGAFKKGEKRPNQGRPKGKQNVHTTALKDMILNALDKAGGVKYLQQQATKNPTAFIGLIGKVLPLQVTGQDGEAIKHEVSIIERVIVDTKAAD